MKTASLAIAPPSKLLLVLEAPRALTELASGFLATRWLSKNKCGDGHPVIVIPGLMASDRSTVVLRRFLAQRGYDVHGWNLGTNRGLQEGVEDALLENIAALRQRHGKKVSLVGWSLGGVFARELAKKIPGDVRQVITMGTPFKGDPSATNATSIYEFASGRDIDSERSQFASLGVSPDVPTSTIYSKTDGVVAWQCSVESRGALKENIEVRGSHCGLVGNPLVLHAIADRLSQPDGKWKPFRAPGLVSYLYPSSNNPARQSRSRRGRTTLNAARS